MKKMILFGAVASMMVASPAMAQKKAAEKSAKPAATTMKVDPAASTVAWTGKKVLVDSAHSGSLKLKSGEVELTGNTLTKGNFVIDMNSLTNEDLKADPKGKGKLEGHLKSADFFDTAKFPEATFKMTSAKNLPKPAAGQPTHEITGDLTLKGVTKPVTFPATVTVAGDKAEAVANLKIDRTNWDVRYGSGKFFEGLGDKVIADEIALDVKLTATK